MKKVIVMLLAALLCFSLVMTGCTNPNNNNDETTPSVAETTASPETTKDANETTTADATTTQKTDETTAKPEETTAKQEETTKKPDDPIVPVVGEREKWLDYSLLGAKDAGSVKSNYAPTGTALSNFEVGASGTYYLTSDVTAQATIESFNGTIDGNGHTINTFSPLFVNFTGTLKNVTITGSVEFAANNGIICADVVGDAVFENVKITTTITVSEGAAALAAGAFIGNCTSTGKISFENCEFAGSLTSILATSGNDRKSGGFMGIAGTGEYSFVSCTNSAAITASSHVGGFIGEISDNTKADFFKCLNSGDIGNVQQGQSGGFIGYGNGATQAGMTFTMNNCRNTGKITNTASNAAGLFCRSGSGSILNSLTFEYCSNTGKIEGAGIASGIIGQLAYITTVKNCLNEGEIVTTGDNYAAGIVGYISEMITIENSRNIGTISAPNSSKYIGGILGCCTKTGAYISNCTNIADISSGNDSVKGGRVGGIAGSAGGVSEIVDCYNIGNLTLTTSAKGQPIAGISGYLADGSVISGCFNMGDVTSNSYACGILGYVNGISVEIKNCYNAGKITAADLAAEISYNKNAESAYPTGNMYMLRTGETAQNAYFKGDTLEKSNDGATTFTTEEMKNGTLLTKLNTAVGSDYWTAGIETDGPTQKSNA